MAYEKQTWVTGEVITKEKLNHMEDGISTGGGIYTYGEVSLFDESVTTAKQSDDATFAQAGITLQGELPKSDISVTFNGWDYTLPYGNGAAGDYWGEIGETVVEGLTVNVPVFTNYPLLILASSDGYMVATPEAGTYSLKINETVEKFTVNDGFKSALENVLITTLDPDTDKLNKTFKEIKDAYNTGLVIIKATEEEPGDLTEVVAFVSASKRELISIGYNFESNKVDIFRYGAETINSYPNIIHS